MRIDAHHHFWDLKRFDYGWLQAPELEAIRRDFGPDDLLPLIRGKGIDRTVLVQTLHSLDENRWALSLAESRDWIAGVVGWIDLTDPLCAVQLAKFRDHPKFVGVRHLVHNEPDDDFIVRDDMVRGLAVLEANDVPFDLLFYVQHLRHVPELANRLPRLRMVIDHLAKPKIKDRVIEDWKRDLQAAAHRPNVWCKLSGLITEASWGDWTSADLKPYVHAALDAFGAERCMFGSDWPVCRLAGSYDQAVEALEDALGPLSLSERSAIFGGTASAFYGLKGAPAPAPRAGGPESGAE